MSVTSLRSAPVSGGGARGGGSGMGVRIEPVRGRRDLRRFIELSWRVNAGDPNWVPPLRSDLLAALRRDKHPFHQHASVEYFLAWRGDRVVGRIAAIVNPRHVEFHEEPVGFFGFFEAERDAEAASLLLTAAEDWVRARGMERIRGPFSFSTNDETGLAAVLVDGFEHPPSIMMAHNPPYYGELIEGAGYGKAKDLLAYMLEGPKPPDRLVRGVGRLQKRAGVQIRPVALRRLRDEIAIIKGIYNAAWARNWGFVPMTDAEFAHLARQLRPVLEPSLCLIAEVGGEPVGFALALPDYNQALKHVNGRLFPLGLLKLLWYRRRIDAARVLTLGLKPGYRRMGIDAMLYLRIFEEGVKLGYTRAECSWILEDNWEMRRGLERLGAYVYKTYRLYEKAL